MEGAEGGSEAALVAMGLGTEAQVEEALALVDGDFDAALQLLLAAASEPDIDASGAEQTFASRSGPRLADDKLELLMELTGCGVLVASKALARVRGDAEAASQQLLVDDGGTEPEDNTRCMLTPEELVWALGGSFASTGLQAQLEAICSVDGRRLQPYMRSTVSRALLAFLRERQPGAERDLGWRDTAAWVARVLNAVADGSHLLNLTTVELLLECCLGGMGSTNSTGKACALVGSSLLDNASGSLNDVLCAVLRRIDLETQGETELRQASCAIVLDGMLQLISAFAAENPRSPLPAACQTAMELTRSLAQEASVVKNVWPTEQTALSLAVVLRHGDDDYQAQVGGLDILHGLVGAYSQSTATAPGPSAELLALLTSAEGALLSALLAIVAHPPGSHDADAGAAVCVVYTEACALVSEIFSASSVISDMFCEVSYGAASSTASSDESEYQQDCLLSFYSRDCAEEVKLANVYYGGHRATWLATRSGSAPSLQDTSSSVDITSCTPEPESGAELKPVIVPELVPEPEPDTRPELREVGILQAMLSALDADVGCSAVYDAAIAVLSTIAQVYEHGHATAQRELHEWVEQQGSSGESDESQSPAAVEKLTIGEHGTEMEEMQEVWMQRLCVRDVFLRCSNSWSMQTRLQTPRAALSFSALDGHEWEQLNSAKIDDSNDLESALNRGWSSFMQAVLPRLLQAHYRHARTCSFLSVVLSFLQSEALTAPNASNIAPQLAAVVRELLSQSAPQMCLLALKLMEATLSCKDVSIAAVAAQAFARQGLDDILRRGFETADNSRIQGAYKQCCELLSNAVVLPHDEIVVSMDRIAKQLAHGEIEALATLRHHLSSEIGVTLHEAERADLFAAIFQLIQRTGVDVIIERLDQNSLLRLCTLLHESVGCLSLPVYQLPMNMRGSVNSTADSGLSCLFQPLCVRFWRGNSASDDDGEQVSGLFEPIVSIAELQSFLLRRVKIRHPRFLTYCKDLVGCWIDDWAEDAEGNKRRRVAYVVAFDEEKSEHIVLYEANVSPPLVRSKFARRQHSVLVGRYSEHEVVTRAKDALEKAAQESANSMWKTLFGSSNVKSLIGVRVAARSSCDSREDCHRWRPATIVAGHPAGCTSVSLVFDDDLGGKIHSVDIVDQDSNQCVFNLMHAAASAAPEQADGCTWQWLDDDGWRDFSDEDCYKLESSRQNGSHGCALTRSDHQIIQIDFKAMRQRSIGSELEAVGEDKPIRRAASSVNLWSAIERPRAGSDQTQRRALSESDAIIDNDIDSQAYANDSQTQKRPTTPTLNVTLHDLRGYLESSSPHASHGRKADVLSDGQLGEDEARKDGLAARNRPLNSDMTLFQCIMHSAAGNNFSWDNIWSVDFSLQVDGEADAQSCSTQISSPVPEATSDLNAVQQDGKKQNYGLPPTAYVVKGSSLQRINGRYEVSDSTFVHENPVYLGTDDAQGKLLYWQPQHDGEWVIADEVGRGYRAVNRTESTCTFYENAPRQCWHVWKGNTKEWVDELSVTVEQVQPLDSVSVSVSLADRLPEPEPEPESEPEPEPEPELESALDHVALQDDTQLVVVVMENQRCDRNRDREFRAGALLPSERGEWTDADGNPLPSPHSDPDPPEGWAWLPQSKAASGWSTPTGWLYSLSFATHESHWIEQQSTALGSQPCVRRRRWERRVIRLPSPPSTPRTPAKSEASSARQSWGAPAQLVRMMMEDGSSDFKRQWGLDINPRGSPHSSGGTISGIDFDRIAAQMGEQFVMQAFRDFQGTAFSAVSMTPAANASVGSVAELPSYTDALKLPVVEVPPPPSYAVVMGTSTLPSSIATTDVDHDLCSAVVDGTSESSASPEHVQPSSQSHPMPFELPEVLQLALELDTTDGEKDDPFAANPVRSPCASLIYGNSGSYRKFDTRDISSCSDSYKTENDLRSSIEHRSSASSLSCVALEVLALLHAHYDNNIQAGSSYEPAPTSMLSASVWVNGSVIFKLRRQLNDPLAVVASAFPEWIEELMSAYPFLFPIAVREDFFRVSAFGAARAVEWLRLQRQQHHNAGTNAPLGDRLGPLRVERWLIRRDDFLNQARQLLCHHAARRSLLQVEFEGESGIGTGVHVSFFTDAATRLSESAENEQVGMWMPDSSLPQGDTLQCALHPVSLLGINADQLSGTVATVLRRFELLGWLFGKALIDRRHDERLLPLRLSPFFIDLALGRELTIKPSMQQYGEWAPLAGLAAEEVQGGAMVLLLLDQLHGVRNGTIAVDDAATMIEICDITFVDPAANETPLCPDGHDRSLSWPDVEEFLGLLASSWLGDGVRLQCAAFGRALGQVVPLYKLNLFTTPELLELVCGAAVEWSAHDLEQCVVPGDGYTRDSEPYRWLLEILENLSASGADRSLGADKMRQRAAFLEFVTARPRLPSGGLHALPCPIRVQDPGSGTSGPTQYDIDGRLPTAHTCSLTLDLPSYSTKKILEDRLAGALALMAEYEGLVD